MLLEENQIAFHSDDGMNYDGVKDYSHLIAEMIGLGSDTEFLQAGVSSTFVLDIDVSLFFYLFVSLFVSLKSIILVCK